MKKRKSGEPEMFAGSLAGLTHEALFTGKTFNQLGSFASEHHPVDRLKAYTRGALARAFVTMARVESVYAFEHLRHEEVPDLTASAWALAVRHSQDQSLWSTFK